MTTFVTVGSYAYRSDAEIAQARLAADGIKSLVHADDEGGLSPGFFRDHAIRLEVATEDEADALASLGVGRITVPRDVAVAMRNHALSSYPMEACGLLASDGAGRLVFVACLSNAARSPKRFLIGPEEHFGAMRFFESMGWTVSGMFHSHPRSAAVPSGEDLAGGGDPEWIHLIIGPVVGRNPELRGFRFGGDGPSELSVAVEA